LKKGTEGDRDGKMSKFGRNWTIKSRKSTEFMKRGMKKWKRKGRLGVGVVGGGGVW
jgi:hypothetical protein